MGDHSARASVRDRPCLPDSCMTIFLNCVLGSRRPSAKLREVQANPRNLKLYGCHADATS